MIKDNFNVLSSSKFGDPFLLQMSLSGKVIAGSDIRNLRPNTKQGPRTVVKRVLPLNKEEMQRAKACDEMIQFEK